MSTPKSNFYRFSTSPMYTIVAGKDATEFQVHSALLSEKSPTFRALIDGFKWSESSEQKVVWENWSADTVSSFVEWLYTGEYQCVFPVRTKKPNPDGKTEEDTIASEKLGPGVLEDEKLKANLWQEVKKHWSEVLRDQEEAHRKTLSQLKGKSATNGDTPGGESKLCEKAEAAWGAVEELRAELEKTIIREEESKKAAAELAARMRSEQDAEENLKELLKELAACSEQAAAIFRDREEQERHLAELENLAKEADKAITKDDRTRKGTRLRELLEIEKENRLRRLQDDAEVDTKRKKEYLAFIRQPLQEINLLTAAQFKKPTSQLQRFNDWFGFLHYSLDNIDFEAPFLRHASVYALAEYTQIPDLKQYAFRALQVVLGQISPLPADAIAAQNFVSLAQYVFENVDGSQEPLREMIACYGAWNHVRLLPIDEYKWLLDAGGDFVTALSTNLAKRLV